jgi:hypothetical protein
MKTYWWTKATERSHVVCWDDVTEANRLSGYCCVPFQSILAYVNILKELE